MIRMKKKLRIAIFDPPRKTFGGGSRMMPKVASHLSKKYYVELFTTKYDTSGLDFGDAKITFLKPSIKLLSPVAYFIKRVKNFDLVINVTSFPANFSAFRNKPCLTICCAPIRHFYDLEEHFLKEANFKERIVLILKKILFKRLDYIANQKTKKILTVSRSEKEQILKHYKRDSEIFYPGVNFDQFKKGEYQDYILSVARLTSHKRVDLIIKSMGLVKNKDVKLKIVGTGPEEEKIKKLCSKHSNVEFMSFVDDDRLKELYSNCLAFAYVPIKEPLGLVQIEAGASYKTTIASNEGGIKDTILNNETGFLIDEVNPEKIAEKIDLLANDKSLAKKMGIAAHDYLLKFDWKNTLKTLDKAVSEIIINEHKE